MNMTKINEKITFLRKEKGVTQEELAKALGVTNQAVSKWESGQCCPDISLIPALAGYFKVSIDELFGYTFQNSETRSGKEDFIFELRNRFASMPEEDVFESAYRIVLLMHEVMVSNGYRNELQWDSDKANARKDTYYWGFSACSVAEGSTARAGNGVFVSLGRDYKTPSEEDLHKLLLTLKLMTKPNVLQVMYALYNLTVNDFDRYVSAKEIAEAAELTEEDTVAAMESLPLTLKKREERICYRLGGGYMHVPSMLQLLQSRFLFP